MDDRHTQLVERIQRAIESCALPRLLPVLEWRGEEYVVDGRLREFRAVTNPGVVIGFETPAGREMIDGSYVMRCPTCRQPAVSPVEVQPQNIKCRRCGRRFPRNADRPG